MISALNLYPKNAFNLTPVAAMYMLITLASVASQLSATQPTGLKVDGSVTLVHDFPKNPAKALSIDQETYVRINMTNKGISPKTVIGLTGFFTDPTDASKIYRNISFEKITRTIHPGKKAVLKYKITPEMDQQDVGLLVLVDFYDLEDTGYRQVGCLEKVSLVYTDSNILIYLLLAGAAYGIYKIVTTPEASDGKPKKKKAVVVQQPAVELAAGEVDMTWIPDHVKAQAKSTSPKPRKRK